MAGGLESNTPHKRQWGLIGQGAPGTAFTSLAGSYLLDIAESISTDSSISNLTPREREVVNLIARGYTYKETASRLQMAVKTLENHMGHIFHKLSIASQHELTRIAYDEGYIRPDDD